MTVCTSESDGVVQRITFRCIPDAERFNLNEGPPKSDSEIMICFLERWLSELSTIQILDSYSKFISTGMIKAYPENATFFNKTGEGLWPFVRTESIMWISRVEVEFFVDRSNLCQCMTKQISIETDYEYDSIGFPFFAQLGRNICTRSNQNEKMDSRIWARFRFELLNVFARDFSQILKRRSHRQLYVYYLI